MVIIYVEDEWQELRPGTKVIVFDGFYRGGLENEEFRIHSGLGLGISHHNSRTYGGNIWAKI